MAAKYQFGITLSGFYGTVQTCNRNATAEIAEVIGEDGKRLEQNAFSKTVEVSYEAVLATGDTAVPDAGETLTVGSVDYLITTSGIAETNTDYVRASGTAQLKDAANLVEYTTPST